MNGNRQSIVLAARPEGSPKPSDFRLEETPIPAAAEGEVLVRVIWLSLDPYMRGRMDGGKSYAKPVEIGGVMEAGCVGQVLHSNDPSLSEGDFVVGRLGWQTHAVAPAKELQKIDPQVAPISTALGVLGMPGLTAYVGLTEFGRPKEGETLVVGAATGAVGSLVGQLGKIYGLRVVGVAGGAEKCAFAREELGFDTCIDHRAADDVKGMQNLLADACPDGVDIYFENVGGKTLQAVVPLMNVHGRIPVCGTISWYNQGGQGADAPAPDLFPKVWRSILVNRLSVRGFIIFDHYDRYPDFAMEVSAYIRDGRVKYRESVSEGLASAPEAFIGLLQGQNFGKQLVRVSEDPTQSD